MAEMKTLTINGVKFDITDDAAVRFEEQSLTEEQKAQARENIGVTGGNVMIVTVNDEDMASHSPAEIYEHVQNGGIVRLNYLGVTGELAYVDNDGEKAMFTIYDRDGLWWDGHRHAIIMIFDDSYVDYDGFATVQDVSAKIAIYSPKSGSNTPFYNKIRDYVLEGYNVIFKDNDDNIYTFAGLSDSYANFFRVSPEEGSLRVASYPSDSNTIEYHEYAFS